MAADNEHCALLVNGHGLSDPGHTRYGYNGKSVMVGRVERSGEYT